MAGAVIEERLHGERTLRFLRQERVIGSDVPIAVEVSTPLDGPTRPPVVLVHGFAQNRFTWHVSAAGHADARSNSWRPDPLDPPGGALPDGRSFVAALVERGHEVHNVELRGHGRSREVGSPSATSFEDYIEDVVAVVGALDEAPFLIGHSLGGAIGVAVAGRVPLRGLIPVAGIFTFATHNRTLRALARLTVEVSPVLRRIHVRTGSLGGLLGRLYALTDIAGYGLPLAGWTPGSLERDLLAERLRLGFDWTSLQVWCEMSDWATGTPVPGTADFGEVRTPLLVVVGDADPLVHPEDARAAFEASGATDKRLALFDRFEHGHHWGHIDLILGREAPDVVWPVMLDWLQDR